MSPTDCPLSMSSLPTWPDSEGPRILTLVGNDLTIDVRARKTASSLARAGYSVISIGISTSPGVATSERLDGALLWRVQVPLGTGFNPHRFPTSRAQVRDWLQPRVQARRSRLAARRRNATAVRYWATRTDPAVTRLAGRGFSFVLRPIVRDDEERSRLRAGFDRRVRWVERKVRFGPRRLVLILDQKFTAALNLAYRVAARPGTAWLKPTWRRDLPELHRYEAALGGIVDHLEPDLIHVHDIFHLGLAARAKARARFNHRDIRVVYDAHELVPGLPIHDRTRHAYMDLEEEYIRSVDAVVTVSEELAQRIADRYETELPSIVLNAPDTGTYVSSGTVRDACGLDQDDLVAVYVGGLAPHRGAELMLEAVGQVSRLHLVWVTNPDSKYIQDLVKSVQGAPMERRLHLAPLVAPEAVVSYISGADVSLIPLSRDVENYEVALPNKLFQSIHARVPVVVSDNPAMADFVRQTGVGEVFGGGDSDSLAGAIKTVLSMRDHYWKALDDEELRSATSWVTPNVNPPKGLRRVGRDPYEDTPCRISCGERHRPRRTRAQDSCGCRRCGLSIDNRVLHVGRSVRK